MSIFAPCNYASNIAYYHTAWEVCQHDSWNVGDEYGKSNHSSIPR